MKKFRTVASVIIMVIAGIACIVYAIDNHEEQGKFPFIGKSQRTKNRDLQRGCDYMKNNSPQKQAAISWIILMIGILLAVIGAMTAKEYRVNLCLLIGAMVVIGGIVYHLTMMKCPYCGCSLVGYRPIPKECPKCHKKFEE